MASYLESRQETGTSSHNAIEVNGLTKKFGDFTAVDSINLHIKKGEIFGLLGPNGAGKTTMISMLATLLKPTAGAAKIWNIDVSKDQHDVRQMIGIVFQDPSLDDELTGWENLDFHGRLYGIDKKTRKDRIKEVLDLVELSDKADKIVRTYSGGMKRRLEIARGLMHRPKVLFLDEPTIGLDPQTRRRLWDYIKALNKKEQITIIITTHYMDEADVLCDRIAIVDHGKMIALETPHNLKRSLGGDLISLSSSNPEKLKQLLERSKRINSVSIVENNLNITVENGDSILPFIMQIAQKSKISVNSVSMKTPTLEDVFIHHTGRAIRDVETEGKDMMMLAATMMRR